MCHRATAHVIQLPLFTTLARDVSRLCKFPNQSALVKRLSQCLPARQPASIKRFNYATVCVCNCLFIKHSERACSVPRTGDARQDKQDMRTRI